jgi:hypothetical protein
MSELKQIRIFKLKIFDHCIFASLNTKKFGKNLVDAPMRFLITQNGLKMKGYRFGPIEWSIVYFIFKKKGKLSFILFLPVFSAFLCFFFLNLFFF